MVRLGQREHCERVLAVCFQFLETDHLRFDQIELADFYFSILVLIAQYFTKYMDDIV